ncbi:tripartite motif-containing protein 16-like [Plectropomus leopardus]|uniref:tripartite motif-containing protein 16-like n=1 Tax=Plectropomus leopardus TaxID=160734 RepID=UPI001C4BEB08|nr:tripartite motif-containing protein 16-like [Plectropomus leopardus]
MSKGNMAQGIQLDQAKFCCPICLDLLRDPVTIPCGHSYCMHCIKDHLDQDDHRRIYSCPQCRQIFNPRPAVVKNNMLAVVVEELKKTRVQAAPVSQCYAGPEDVACDVCKVKAFKSCLQCLASYCERHLQSHYDVAPLRKHKLVEATAKLQENICSRHQEVMKLFCRTDQRCICYLCSKDDHKGHTKVSAAAERTEKQRELWVTLKKIQQRIQDKEKDVKLFQQEEDAVNNSAENALRNTEKTLTELISIIERRVSDVREKVKSRQTTEVGRYRKVREKLEQEITELKRRDTELKKLSHTEDHTHFLLNYPSLARLSESKVPPSFKVRRLRYFEKVTVALSEAKDKLQEVLREEYVKISKTVTEADVSPPNPLAEPTTRVDFLQYARQVTLDPNTANTHLSISKGNRKAAYMREEQKYSVHPERFQSSWQVLSRESLTGRCYWEVERSGRGVLLAVAYKHISREGDMAKCMFGLNDKSWALDCYMNSLEFRHNNAKTAIPDINGKDTDKWASRLGVYLDHGAGILSFYSISETMTLLHRVQTTFTQPLYAGLWLSEGAAAELCELK